MNFLGKSREKRLIEVQKRIASKVILQDNFSIDAVAGVDQAFLLQWVISAALVFDRSMQILSISHSRYKEALPYVPGFLSFREGAPAIGAVRGLGIKPTLLFVDGCGINHPRMAGLACFIGVILNIPTVGISKNVLCGEFEIPEQVGEAKPLIFQDKLVGYVLLSKKGCRPIIVAPGHWISADSALETARLYLSDHKLPEPCRQAHEQARRFKNDLSPVKGAFP
jgi:deoxyribonuclease V